MALLGRRRGGGTRRAARRSAPPFHSTVGPAFGLDPLSGFFLALLAFTAIPTLLFARDYLPGSPDAPRGRRR